MPVEFLTEAQKQSYGRFAGEPTEAQLARYFHLDNTDLALIHQHRGDHNRLGFALQLTTVRFLGTFLPDPTQVPSGVLHFLARQLGITEMGIIEKYLDRKATRYSHSTEIQQSYAYDPFARKPTCFNRWHPGYPMASAARRDCCLRISVIKYTYKTWRGGVKTPAMCTLKTSDCRFRWEVRRVKSETTRLVS
jgi:hypothetical protein